MNQDKLFGIPIEGAYERYLAKIAKAPETPPQGSSLDSIVSNPDSWSIPGVSYRNKVHIVDLSKTLSDSKTQDQHAQDTAQSIQNNQFHTSSFPLYHALFTALFNSRNGSDKNQVEEIRKFLADSIEKQWLVALTRVAYNPQEPDKVIHNYRLKDQYEIQENMVGQNEWVKDSTNPAPYKALLDTDNTQEINQVWSWLTGKNAYLFRVNAKPKQIDERVARFNSDSGGVNLVCYGCPQFSGLALPVRVRAAHQKKSGNKS